MSRESFSKELVTVDFKSTLAKSANTDLQKAFCDVTNLRNAGLPMVRSQTD